jgi:hypothetical protein
MADTKDGRESVAECMDIVHQMTARVPKSSLQSEPYIRLHLASEVLVASTVDIDEVEMIRIYFPDVLSLE